MKTRISISTVRKANNKMRSGSLVSRPVANAIAVTVNTGKLIKTYDISTDKINQAYKLAKAK